MRIRAMVAYDGTPFYGWQLQDARFPTIQSKIEESLERIGRVPVRVAGAGRTDTGVHAYGQVAHWDWYNPLPCEKLTLALNALLPEEIRILSTEEADPSFNSRYDARSKIYLYRIDLSRVYNPFTYRYALHYRRPLDAELVQRVAATLLGEHDFSAFQASGTEIVRTRRRMMRVEVLPEVRESPHIPPLMYIRFQADGFLRKMVRYLVGTLLEIGSGRRPVDDLERALQTGERHYAGIPAPARGLFLEKVFY